MDTMMPLICSEMSINMLLSHDMVDLLTAITIDTNPCFKIKTLRHI